MNTNAAQLQRTAVIGRMRDMQNEKSCMGGIPKYLHENGFDVSRIAKGYIREHSILQKLFKVNTLAECLKPSKKQKPERKFGMKFDARWQRC